MDIRSYFGSTSQASSDANADSDSEVRGSDSSDPESSPSPPPSKKVCKSSKNKRYHRSVSTKRKYSKSWEKNFSWLYYDEDSERSLLQDLQAIWNFWSSAYWRGVGHKTLQKLRKLLKK